MTVVTPPRPTRPPDQASLLETLRRGMRSSLAAFYDASFNHDIGRVSIRVFPFLKRRSIFTIREPEAAREVLIRRADAFRKSDIMSVMLADVTGDSVFTSNGETWRRQRRLMDPAFASAGLKSVFPMMQDACVTALARLEAQALAAPGKPVDVDRAMTYFAADVIFRTIFSEEISAADARDIFAAFEIFQKVSYVQGMLKAAHYPAGLVVGAGRARRAANRIRQILKAPLDRRMARLRDGLACTQSDILAALLKAVEPETGKGFDDVELLDQISVLFLAGHETTASALAWSLYLLAIDPATQGRLHDEVQAVLANRAPAFSDMKRLPLARDIFRETLRLYPPVAFFARDATRPVCLGEREIDAESVVVIAPWLLHRHAKHWANPDGFDPGRFSTPEGQESARCAYMPFSTGERVCIGASFALQEATLFLAECSRRFRVAPEPGHTPEPVARLTLRSGNGIRLRFEAR